MILFVFLSKNCSSFLARELFGKIKYASLRGKIKCLKITFVLFRTEKDHYENTKKRQEHSHITSP